MISASVNVARLSLSPPVMTNSTMAVSSNCDSANKDINSMEMEYDPELSNTNSNGNLTLSEPVNAPTDTATDPNPCLRSFKACCKKKADFGKCGPSGMARLTHSPAAGLEDIFWLLFLLIIIAFSIVKSVTRVGWSQLFYMILGAIFVLIVLYVFATAFNKFVLEDSSTAHWNAHARFTQAAIQSRLREEEQRVHVIAPPKMGGAKLNIIYSVGDVPLSRESSKNSRHASSGSLGVQNVLSNLTQQTVSTAAAALIASTALPSSPSTKPVPPPLSRPEAAGGGGPDSVASPSRPSHPFPPTPMSPLAAHHETIEEEERVESPSTTEVSQHEQHYTSTPGGSPQHCSHLAAPADSEDQTSRK